MSVFRSCAPVLLMVTVLAGCAESRETREAARQDREAVVDVPTLVSYLDRRGISFMDNGPISAPGLMASGYEFTPMSGGNLYIFSYKNGGDALSSITWVEGNRDTRDGRAVYRKESLVVIYTGDDPRLHRALVRVMGSPIA